MFSPKKGRSFLKESFETLVVWGIVVKGSGYLWEALGVETPELVWAYTVATGLAALYMAMYICFGRQVVFQDRIDEKAEYCAKLEQQLLRKRQSSGKKK